MGSQGHFYHNNRQIAQVKNFKNNDCIGCLLDMNNFTLKYYVNGNHVMTYTNKKWEVCFRSFDYC